MFATAGGVCGCFAFEAAAAEGRAGCVLVVGHDEMLQCLVNSSGLVGNVSTKCWCRRDDCARELTFGNVS